MGKKMLKITLVKSPIGRIYTHKRTVKSLGLKKLHYTVIQDDTPSVRGMINKVSYLLHVENIEGEENPSS
ncbi:MAG: 50S ribosomal protein L30 [Candidatus Atribacteria bacterium]|nr:50S ribosomal protein L30 [Candidatus Atribacteria bacterium]